MARQKRKRSKEGLYHVMLQSAKGLELWKEDREKEAYLNILKNGCVRDGILLVGYCILDRSIHLLLQEEREGTLSSLFRRANSIYLRQYRKQHQIPEGTQLLRDRFYSEPVGDGWDLARLLRQIHQLPVTRGLVKEESLYPWSSCKIYLGEERILPPMSVRRVLEEVHYAGGFSSFTNSEKTPIPMLREKSEHYGISDKEAIRIVESYLEGKKIWDLLSLEKKEQRVLLLKIREQEGISIQQLCRITGIPRSRMQD